MTGHHPSRRAWDEGTASIEALFDASYYCAVAKLGANADALAHYLTKGADEGCDPHPLFSTSYYRQLNPDVTRAGVNPLAHYVSSGGVERRPFHPLFDTSYYLAQATRDGQAVRNPLLHFLRIGVHERWSPHPLIDVTYILGIFPELYTSGVNPVLHCLRTGASTHPLFDVTHYARQRPEAAFPLLDFVTTGSRTGLSPHPLFDPVYYLETNPDVADAGVDPFVHYLSGGAAEQRSPHPLLDAAYYARQCEGEIGATRNALLHFVTVGAWRGTNPHPSFDHAEAGMNPLVHLVRHGGAVVSSGGAVEPADRRDLISVPDTAEDDDAVTRQTTAHRAALQAGAWWHTIDLGDGRVSVGVHSAEQLSRLYAGLKLPDDLSGHRLLDVGCWDGFYSFEAERRGAQVTAVDCFRPENFFIARDALRSRVDFHEMSVYELSRDRIGSFDVVLFLGVLYHLRHPLLGLERICEVTAGAALIESHVITGCSQGPVMRFYEVDELGGQYDNWWGPDVDCLLRMVRAAGFVDAVVLRVESGRALIRASRSWHHSLSTEERPSLQIAVQNAVSGETAVPTRGRHAFVAIHAQGVREGVAREDVRVHIGPFGANAVFLAHSEPSGRAQINAPVPPGLDAGVLPVWIEAGAQRSDTVHVRFVDGTDW